MAKTMEKRIFVILSIVGLAGAGLLSQSVLAHASSRAIPETAKQKIMDSIQKRLNTPAPYLTQAAKQAASHLQPATPPTKPTITPGAVLPMPNGTWQIPFLNNGPYHITNLWLKDVVFQDHVWNEDFVFSGTSTANGGQGVIGRFVINTNQFQTWILPNPPGSYVHITNVEGNIVDYSTSNGSGTFNLSTDQFSQ